MSDELPTLPKGYVPLLNELAAYNVAISERALKTLKKASKEKLAELESLILEYSKKGPSALPRTKFNGGEGWFPSVKAPNKVRLEAFKPWQLRAYGFCRQYKGRPWFFITGIALTKKRDGADQNVLDSAAKEAVRVNDEIERR